jgi:hypothetical protein
MIQPPSPAPNSDASDFPAPAATGVWPAICDFPPERPPLRDAVVDALAAAGFLNRREVGTGGRVYAIWIAVPLRPAIIAAPRPPAPRPPQNVDLAADVYLALG